MATNSADASWTLKRGEDFLKGRFSRGHTVSFGRGIVVPASASPHVARKWAVEAAVDPEEMLVAALVGQIEGVLLPLVGQGRDWGVAPAQRKRGLPLHDDAAARPPSLDRAGQARP